MANRDEILNLYRHVRGLYRAVSKLAQDEKVIKCWTCRGFHLTTEPHASPIKENVKDMNAESGSKNLKET